MLLVDGAGRERFRMGAELLGDSGGFIADIEILRGDLVKILPTATREGVEYMFDDSITALDEEDDGVFVSFRRATRRRFDLVVGADGLHSNVRRLAFGEESTFVQDSGRLCRGISGAFCVRPGRMASNVWRARPQRDSRQDGSPLSASWP